MNSGIYKITCISNGKYYYGRTLDLKRRKAQHISDLRGGKHANPFLQRVYNKYGEENIVFELVLPLEGDVKVQEKIEQDIIDKHFKNPLCMNVSSRASGGCPEVHRNKVISEETRKKLSLAHRGHKHSEETKKKMGLSRMGDKNGNAKEVYQIDKKTGEIIERYTSIKGASRVTGVNHINIIRVCKGQRKSAGGFIWSYHKPS